MEEHEKTITTKLPHVTELCKCFNPLTYGGLIFNPPEGSEIRTEIFL